ncbi:hypothetical protein M569_04812, partial [Genlisea aurea]
LCILLFIVGYELVEIEKAVAVDYGEALTKSLLFYEAQRSGKLPLNQRLGWRSDSALRDGADAGVDLVGGYYDAGDNVKFGFPMAFTVTMLSWSALEFRRRLEAGKELDNALAAIKWGTDYLVKAHAEPEVLYGQVGDGGSDHSCWQRPEDMTTPRTAYRIDAQHPGSDLAGETSAALAAASIVYSARDPVYSAELLRHARELFEFATAHTGLYQNSIPSAGQFYSSSGYEDELLWAAAWLGRATGDQRYWNFIAGNGNTGGTRTMFSWDDKFVGVQLLIAKAIKCTQGVAAGRIPANGRWSEFKNNAEQFICNCIQKGNGNVKKTSGGLLWFDQWNNLQYVTTASFVLAAYAKSLRASGSSIRCPGGVAGPEELVAAARAQVDYVLGSNPMRMSYMVGFGANYPGRVHHRGASIVSIKQNPAPVTCSGGFDQWFRRSEDNPNVLTGAIVGGPDLADQYSDARDNYQQAEPATANNAPLVGVLA